VASWEEGTKLVRNARFFALGAAILLFFLAVYAAILGDEFNAYYFGAFSIISLGLYFYVRKTMKARED